MIRQLVIPCVDDRSAQAFAEYLRAVEEVDVSGVDGRNVSIPWGGDPAFAFGVGEASGEYAHDDEVARAIDAALDGAGWR